MKIRHLACTFVSFLPATWSPAASAATPEQCIATYDRAIQARGSGQLRAALKEFAACAADDCPQAVRTECADLAGKVESSLPTVVFGAVAPDGKEAQAVRVFVDGVIVNESLDGRAVPVDPGRHLVRFEGFGRTVDQELIARQGEKNRAAVIRFAAAPATGNVSERSERRERPPPPTLAWVLGGVGLAALASFAYFGISGRKQENDLKERCAPECSHEEVDRMQRKYLIADISLGAGILALGSATYLLLTGTAPHGRDEARPAQGRSRFFVGIAGQF